MEAGIKVQEQFTKMWMVPMTVPNNFEDMRKRGEKISNEYVSLMEKNMAPTRNLSSSRREHTVSSSLLPSLTLISAIVLPSIQLFFSEPTDETITFFQ